MEGNTQFKTYVKIKNGKWGRLLGVGDDVSGPNVATIESNTGLKEDYILFNYIEGHITALYCTSTQNGHSILNIDMENGEDKRTVQIPFFMDPCAHFMQRMENIDLKEIVRLNIGKDKETSFPFLWVAQPNGNIKARYTKDNREGRPSWEHLPDGNWDKSKEHKWWRVKVGEMGWKIKEIREEMRRANVE